MVLEFGQLMGYSLPAPSLKCIHTFVRNSAVVCQRSAIPSGFLGRNATQVELANRAS
jgi:hypothetical protein